MSDGNGSKLDPDVVRRFHFTRTMVKGAVYRKYKFAIKKIWDVDDLDFSQDAADRERISYGSEGRASRASRPSRVSRVSRGSPDWASR